MFADNSKNCKKTLLNNACKRIFNAQNIFIHQNYSKISTYCINSMILSALALSLTKKMHLLYDNIVNTQFAMQCY